MPNLLNDSVSSEKDVVRKLPVLPILCTLSLDFGFAGIKGDVIKYFGALTSNTLTMLSMGEFLSYQDVKLILKVFNQCDILVDLRLGIGCITSQLIDLFVERCLSLEKLGLQLDGHYLGKNQITLFEHEMSERKNYLHIGHVYKHWQLHELTFYPELGGFAYHHKAWSIMRAIADAVPSIRTVAGRDRSTALVETPMPHCRY
ncbi:uncharacterized protein LACBIDRAFT_307310 [Laccaria bicolor S238N-H82]|uniref:Predicted protein n=1 Tax=Laccaria bicolor (strain S238N-H82 / ATCC MYA-4686) TaxID=486041 RepID=B0DPV6_LACBS|nr:uncharacterized protein LACBIDRAFT_307310 [Laccaria bicolor S238N-H82]EDR03439.1 predicted protein [Laccaria bicolor S238N-H82]|eukprot:XP_001885895.1 predicted protein [Laccaria bicolor S238N-H82]